MPRSRDTEPFGSLHEPVAAASVVCVVVSADSWAHPTLSEAIKEAGLGGREVQFSC